MNAILPAALNTTDTPSIPPPNGRDSTARTPCRSACGPLPMHNCICATTSTLRFSRSLGTHYTLPSTDRTTRRICVRMMTVIRGWQLIIVSNASGCLPRNRDWELDIFFNCLSTSISRICCHRSNLRLSCSCLVLRLMSGLKFCTSYNDGDCMIQCQSTLSSRNPSCSRIVNGLFHLRAAPGLLGSDGHAHLLLILASRATS
jgi:hypothetical protein